MQFPAAVTPAQRSALAQAARIYTYLPPNAYLVRLEDRASEASLNALGVRWQGDWQAAYKVGRGVRAVALTDSSERKRQLMLQLFPDLVSRLYGV